MAVAHRPRLSIASAISYPQDSTAPSLLTSLPLDIRKLIYDDLFKHERPVTLVCERYHLSAEGDWDEARGTREYDQFISWSLLLSCRQIYHEAAGVLYGNNSWLFTSLLDEHEDANCATLGASLWMSTIGSNIRLVKNIIIDVGPRCHDQCDELRNRSTDIDLGQLINNIWKFGTDELRVTFQDSGRRLLVEVHEHDEEMRGPDEKWTYTNPSDLLNNLLRILAYEDVFQMRRYSQFGKMIEARFSFDLETGTLKVFHHITSEELEFRILDEGNKMEEVPGPRSKLSLLEQMPPRAASEVLRLCHPCSDEIVVDLSARKVYGVDFTLGRLSVFKWPFGDILAKAKVTCKMITSKTSIPADDLRALQEWKRIHSRYTVTAPWQNLVLEFDVDPKTSLKDLRINLDGDYGLGLGPSQDVRSIIIRKMRYDGFLINKDSGCAITVPILARRIFLTMSDLLVSQPNARNHDSPSACIDGCGQVLSVTLPGVMSDGTDYVFKDTVNRDLGDEFIDIFGLMQERRIRLSTNIYNHAFGLRGVAQFWKSLALYCWPSTPKPIDTVGEATVVDIGFYGIEMTILSQEEWRARHPCHIPTVTLISSGRTQGGS